MFLKYQFQVNDIIKILLKREDEIQNNVKHSLYWVKYLWMSLSLFPIRNDGYGLDSSQPYFFKTLWVPEAFRTISESKNLSHLQFNNLYLQVRKEL